MIVQCHKRGSQESGRKGACCCNCQHQRPICAHPGNVIPEHRGSILTVIGYGCAAPDFYPEIIIFDTPHGMCEVWEERSRELSERDKELVYDILST